MNLFKMLFNKSPQGSFDVKLNSISLKFPGELEDEFKKDYFTSSIGFLRTSFLLGIIYYSLFYLLDSYAMPQIKEQLFIIRFFFVCPIILVVFILSFLPGFYRWWQFSAFVATVVSGIGIVWMIVISPEMGKQTYYVGIILVLIYCYMLIKLRFIWASLGGIVIIASYFIAHFLGYTGEIQVFKINLFFLLSANLLGMFGGYCLEFYTRKEFYFRRKLHQESLNIKDKNLLLEEKVKEKTRELQKDIEERKKIQDQMHRNLKEKNLSLKIA